MENNNRLQQSIENTIKAPSDFDNVSQGLNKSSKELKSTEFFKSTKIDSCSHVVIKNGQAQAIPFIPPKKKADDLKSTYNKSLSQ